MIPPKDFIFQYYKKELVAEDTYTLFFKKHEDFEYYPGQYIRLTLENFKEEDPRGNSRMFSISSSPDEDFISITTHKMISPYKKSLLALNQGGRVSVFGPVGRFIIEEEEKCIFLAGGIGITPFMSMVSYHSKKNVNKKIILLASFQRIKDLFFIETAEKIMHENQNIKVVFTLTREEDPSWTGERGRINIDMIRKYAGSLEDYNFFISGPPPMVDDGISMLLENLIPIESIKKEKFSGY